MRSLVLVLGFVAACGTVKDPHALPDAPPPPDAPPDAPPAPVKVTVVSEDGDGLPAQGARVLFQAPDGAVVFDGVVDANGQVEQPFPTGGSITAIRVIEDTSTYRAAIITTLRGAKPGDDATIGVAKTPTVNNQGGATSMTANFSTYPGASYYQVYTECGTAFTSTSPARLNFRDSCHGSTFDLLLVASGGTLTTPQFIRLNGVVHQSGGTFTIPSSYSPMSNFTVNARNVPTEIDSMSVMRASVLNQTPVVYQYANATVGSGTITTQVPYPASFGSRSDIEISMYRSDSPATYRHEARTADLSSTFDADISKMELPWLGSVEFTNSGMRWTQLTTGGSPDGSLLVWGGRWYIGEKSMNLVWRVVQDPSTTTTGVELPRLPAAYAEFDPAQQSVPVSVNRELSGFVLVDYDNLDNYDDFRQAAETLSGWEIGRVGRFPNTAFSRRTLTVGRVRL
ncbi:MAG: hypothetical protein ACTHU0_00765 [Kofleriaceae bacterium]